MQTINKITKTIEKGQILLGSINFSIFVFAVICQVVSRQIEVPMTWTENLANYNFIWAVFMGASVILCRNQHYRFGALEAKCKGKGREIYNIAIFVPILAFSFMLFYYGIELVITFWDYKWTSIPQFKMGWHWMCVPIMGLTMMWYSFANIMRHVTNIKNKDYKHQTLLESIEETEHIDITGKGEVENG